MDKQLSDIINSDLDRCFGQNIRPKFYKLLNPSVRCTIAFRKASFYHNSKHKVKFLFARIQYLLLSQKFCFSIPYTTQIGKGFVVGHTGSVIINERAILGNNINIATGTVIGAAQGKRQGAPIIGSRVWIGSNAIIVGNVKIEDDVLIAPGAFVNFDVPAHSLVIGNPGVIHHKENATENYISNII